MKPSLLASVLLSLVLLATPAAAAIQGSSTVSNCGANEWIDITFTAGDGVQLVDVWWDFSTADGWVWWDRDGGSNCPELNDGVDVWDLYFDGDPAYNTQDWGATAVGFDSGDTYRMALDLDLMISGLDPVTTDYYGGTVTAVFSDGTTVTGTFDAPYDSPNGATAEFFALGPIRPNLALEPRAGWAAPLVPRASDDATSSSVPAPAALAGDTALTWINATCLNESIVCPAPSLVIHRDGVLLDSVNYLFPIAAGSYFGPLNRGPYAISAGRHTLRLTADPEDEITEYDETDNVLAVQYAWTPPLSAPFPYNTPTTRAAPPSSMADLDLLTGTYAENCDGIWIDPADNVPVPQYDWVVVWNRRLSGDGPSYFMKLFLARNHAEDGFLTDLMTTSWEGDLEAVIVNRRTTLDADYDVGVYNYLGEDDPYEICLTSEGPYELVIDSGVETPFVVNRLGLVEFYAGPEHVGPATLTFYRDPAYGPISVGWLGPDHEMGSLADLNDRCETGVDGRAEIHFDIAEAGYHAAVFYRRDLGTTMSVQVQVWTPMPDLEPVAPAGWGAPLVPRPAADATAGSCALPDTLHGNEAATWLNAALLNSGDAVADTAGFGYFVDGGFEMYTYQPLANVAAGGSYLCNNVEKLGTPFTVPGGRHTLTCMADYADQETESDEGNNWAGGQYCWSPEFFPTGRVATRPAPPDRTGGHAECAPGQTLYPNCDGLRVELPASGTPWLVVAVMPQSMDEDVDVALHETLVGALDGFGPHQLAASAFGDGAIDFVVLDGNSAPAGFYDVAVLDDVDDDIAGYALQVVTSTSGDKYPVGPTEPLDMPAGEMLDPYHVVLDAGTQLITLNDLGGEPVDWGISLFGGGPGFCGRGDFLPLAASDQGEAGESEQFLARIPARGEYCIVVWKTSADELAKNGTYRLVFAPGVSGAGDELPAATRLVGAAPNPFNPQTTIAFELAQDGPCHLALYDVQGRLVRTLVAEDRPAGPGEAVWDGLDDQGSRAASGIYLARLRAAGTADLLKVTLVK